jgi:hypothetical protein
MSAAVTCLPPSCTFAGDGLEVQLHIVYQLFISTQTVRGDGPMRVLAEITVILGRDIGCDHFAIGGSQAVRPAEKHLCQRVQRRGGFRTKGHRAEYSGETFR